MDASDGPLRGLKLNGAITTLPVMSLINSGDW